MTGSLRVSDAACARGGVRLLEGVSFEVQKGQALILRGPNGIGKTTLLRAMVGLQHLTSGSVSAEPDEFVYAGHADAVKSTLSVEENLSFWASVFGARSIDKALDAFDLSGLRARFAGELSAGQRRRLGLARLVLAQRPIWALDEPTVALDAENVARFASAVRSHLQTGGLAVMATHIDLGLQATTLDLTQFRARPEITGGFDEAFL